MLNITFQQIEAFLTVGKYLNLSKASEVMFITQPALSKTLQRFEEGVGMQLFKRSNQGLEFTVEGEYLYLNLSASYQNMNKTIKTAQGIASAGTKSLRIVAPSSYDASADFDRLRELVGIYQRKYPEVSVRQTLFDFGELRRTLELGDADLVFAQDFSLMAINGVSFRRISKFELCLAMSAAHPLAERDELDFTALGDECFYSVPIPNEMTTINRTLELCHIMGFEPRELDFVPNFQTLLHTIRSGKGMGICGRFDRLGFEDIKYFPLPEVINNAHIIVAWQDGRLSREAGDFIDLIAENKT